LQSGTHCSSTCARVIDQTSVQPAHCKNPLQCGSVGTHAPLVLLNCDKDCLSMAMKLNLKVNSGPDQHLLRSDPSCVRVQHQDYIIIVETMHIALSLPGLS